MLAVCSQRHAINQVHQIRNDTAPLLASNLTLTRTEPIHDYDAQITNNNATLASQQVSFWEIGKLVTIVMLIINERTILP